MSFACGAVQRGEAYKAGHHEPCPCTVRCTAQNRANTIRSGVRLGESLCRGVGTRADVGRHAWGVWHAPGNRVSNAKSGANKHGPRPCVLLLHSPIKGPDKLQGMEDGRRMQAGAALCNPLTARRASVQHMLDVAGCRSVSGWPGASSGTCP
jgi:hypothetical protein